MEMDAPLSFKEISENWRAITSDVLEQERVDKREIVVLLRGL